MKDCDLGELRASTRGEFTTGGYVVPCGTPGTVAERKARKANILYDETAKCSAIVDVIIEASAGRVQVPYISLCLLTLATPRPDYVSRNEP